MIVLEEKHGLITEEIRYLENVFVLRTLLLFNPFKHSVPESESESELFTGDTSKDNHSPGPVFREVSP